MPVQALAFSGLLPGEDLVEDLVESSGKRPWENLGESPGGNLGKDFGEDSAPGHQDWVDILAACQTVREGWVSCSCHSGTETWEGLVGSEIEAAARQVTEVVVLLVIGVEVQVPSVVPLGEEDLDGREGPLEGPLGALVQAPELQVQVDAVDREEGPWVGCQWGN
ncbi:hypothetical protein diail_2713 [Diaporthe ilicicola]|nr:hypothetical protein diail_2713 [Diaporthe ilicicola]